MQPSRQKRQWHAQWQDEPGSSTEHRETQRRLHGSYLRRENQDHDPWPPRSTSRLQQPRHTHSAPTPSWRDRVIRPENRAQGGNRWILSEAAERGQRQQPPVRRWRSPEPPLRLRSRSELDSSRVSRSWAQRHQNPPPLRTPRSLNVSARGGGRTSTPDPVLYERWDSDEAAKDARSTQRHWVPNDRHDDDDDCDVDDDDDDDDDDDEEEEEEEEAVGEYNDEQNNFTLKHRYSPPARSDERWQNVRAENRVHQPTEGPIRLSHVDHVGALHNQVRSWPAHEQLSHTVEMPARQWSQSDIRFQNSQSELHQEPATRSLTTDSVDVQSYPMRPTRSEMVETRKVATPMVKRPHPTFEAGQVPSLLDNDDEQLNNGDDIGPESNAHSTSKRRPWVLGKRKAILTNDETIVDRDSESGDELVPVKPKVSRRESGKVKPRSHGTRKRHRKRCQYPEGCDKGAEGSTMFCIAHGGGKRCQYPEGCGKSAQGSATFCAAHGGGRRCQYPEGCSKGAEGRTMFCVAHGGGKRCQYPKGCDKSAQGSTFFCVAHGGGKRCQYPDGCDKGALGSTMFCAAHGGGKRCQYPGGCDKSAQGSTMFCRAHGGGKRCQYPDGCDKSALGSTMFCRAHGGGKRCQYPGGCSKGAEGSTMFCVAHGGGKRCQYPEGCGKSAIGRTLCCKAHGGGKRCQYPEGCDKSAQCETMFCIAHGGGKRCQYPEGCDKSALGSTMFCAVHGGGKRCQYPDGCGKSAQGSTMLCAAHGGGKRCGHESGCRKHVKRGGLCKSHGTNVGL
jgi:hypothetical protein